jgi:hypothetical protein
MAWIFCIISSAFGCSCGHEIKNLKHYLEYPLASRFIALSYAIEFLNLCMLLWVPQILLHVAGPASQQFNWTRFA